MDTLRLTLKVLICICLMMVVAYLWGWFLRESFGEERAFLPSLIGGFLVGWFGMHLLKKWVVR